MLKSSLIPALRKQLNTPDKSETPVLSYIKCVNVHLNHRM
uniref:Uncharacterized protein n=1 Tax=Anguilla anguilla TaxID=7936 RepID=A0A0E9UQK5_ANGAN